MNPRRMAVLALVIPLIVGLSWWGFIASARVHPLPPPPPDEGQETNLREGFLASLVRLRPERWQARVALAAVLSGHGADREAAKQLVEASRLDPGNPEILGALGVSADR